MKAFSLGMTVASPDDAREFIAKEIRAAVEAERAACKAIADAHAEGTSKTHEGEHSCGVDDDCGTMISEKIRARGEGEG